jgi:phosphatidylcholine synthase
VAFYLLLLRPPSPVAAGAIALLVALTFVPFAFIHPLRIRRLRPLNLVLLATWAALGLVALARDLAPEGWVSGGLAAIGIYFVAFGLLRGGKNTPP